ncbi:hypothetical protein BASA81_008368 [Batrachochytrium salamandrivorans]|nr:hypothetical protein BASA81_008368 [Batrachochytrium salamandrivorans]
MFPLADLLSPNQALRTSAESRFKSLQQTNPAELCLFLLAAGSDANQASADLGLVLLRQTLRLDFDMGFKTQIAQTILDQIVLGSGGATQRLIEALVVLPKPVLGGLAPKVVGLVSNGSPPAKPVLCLMDGFAEFAYSPQLALEFAQLLTRWLSVEEYQSIELFKASVSLLVSSEDGNNDSGRAVCRDLGRALPMRMIRFAATTNSGEGTLELLCVLAESCDWAMEIGELTNALLAVCETSSLSPKLRALAMAAFGTVAARKANAVCKNQALCHRVLQCIVQLQIEDQDLDGLFEDGDDVDEGDVLQFSQAGQRGSALDCATSLALGSNRVSADSRQLLGIALQRIQPCLVGTWREKLAGLSTLAALGPHFTKPVFRSMLRQVVAGCMQLTGNAREHNKVRFAAAAVVYTFLVEGGEDNDDDGDDDDELWRSQEMRQTMHQDIISALANSLLEASPTPQLVQVWLMTLCAFYGGDGEEVGDFPASAVAPYLDGLVTLLVQLLQRYEAEERILCLAMDALACLGAMGKPHGFAKYYAQLVPSIKHCLATTASSQVKKSSMLLVASCAEAVGKDQFAKDGLAIVEWFFTQHQNQGKTNLDETNEVEGLFLFCGRLAGVLKRDFAVFAPHILPLVVQAAQADLGLAISTTAASATADAEFEQDSGHAKIAVPVRGEAGPVEISANIYAFQLRYKALVLLEELADGECLDAAVIPELLLQCALPNIANRMCTQSLNAQSSATAAALFQRNRAYALALERVLKTCVDKQTCRLPGKLLGNVLPMLVASFSSSVQRRLDSGDGEAAGDFEEEIELCSVLVDVVGHLLKNNPAECSALYSQVVLEYMHGLINTRDEHLRHHALCCFIDYLEFATQEPDARVLYVLQQHLKYALVDPASPKLRQAGAYGAGVVALKLPRSSPAARAFCNEYKPLVRYANETEERDVYDNMVSCLAKMYYANPDRQDWLEEFIALLPLGSDEQEAKYCNELVFDLAIHQQLTSAGKHQAGLLLDKLVGCGYPVPAQVFSALA